ncbi:molecular chaperone DnaJ [Rhodoblastus sphagnicola]|uniref:Molecular chaperone DnaJ n=1 Tax=Rhodoblastus sphagnicola TaxID=333368 RepID=A0A2S6MZ76_9HYPH|nr:J domain-containing protein [Rhodoblastus sphagnicola]MBB4198632.1 DNA-directed RNA polymerase subunit F [Rhodoblastus sphagnicola]PPQ27652.1 molecular chaperone DnaJ [Rhodoblastus sphagnicola]
MGDKREWVVWNGSIGILDMAALGRIERGSAWLAEPYDVVGPFSLDQLETTGRVVFQACLVMSRVRWQAEQVDLRREAQARRREYASRFALFNADKSDEGYRAVLDLPEKGPLSAGKINSAFRHLAKKAHPDAGGDHDSYIRLSEARDILLERAAVAT